MKYCLAFLLCCALLAGALVFAALYEFRNQGPLSQTASVVIPKGTGVVATSDLLTQQNIISSPYVFTVAAKIRGGSGIKAGEYEFVAGQTMEQVLDKMVRGEVVRHRLTIPEGLTNFEVIALLNKTERLTGGVKITAPEGSFLPETYDFQTGDSRDKKAADMITAMEKTLKTLWDGRDQDLPFKTPQEALILASIVEKETGKASERKAIAGVFLNRLRLGMPLQSDPTVIYAINKGHDLNEGQGPLGRRLLTKDLETPSPYNTYQNTGLPPGPIANPGKDAIEAVMHPDRNDYLYFVADGTGGHMFARNLAEHNQNVAKWRLIRASSAP